MTQVIELECPGCGAPLTVNDKTCPYCQRPVVVSTFNSISALTLAELKKHTKAYAKATEDEGEDSAELDLSAAFCYLKLGLYDQALTSFDKAIEGNIDNSEAYFYAAVATLRGKRPFSTPMAEIKKALAYIESAKMIEPKGIYYYLEAYIKYDFHSRKFLIVKPDHKLTLASAKNAGYSEHDVTELFGVLGTERPSVL